MCAGETCRIPNFPGSDMELLSPASLDEAAEAVRAAAADKSSLELLGTSSKRGLGRPVTAQRMMTSAGLSGIVAYHPEELVMTVRAGTHMAEIEAALAEKQQHFAFEPPDYGALYAGDDGPEKPTGSIGGIIATNLSGPRRLVAGAARDHFLGFSGVNGRGEIFKGGGQVVKNVTGYDLPKLMAGSYGTLAFLGEVTVKTLPRPEKVRTVLFHGLDAVAGNLAMTKVLGSNCDVSGAAFLPEGLALRSKTELVGGKGSVTAFRLEGSAPSVEHRCAILRELAGGDTEELHSRNSASFWQEMRDVAAFVEPDAILWRISVPPAEGAKVAAGFSIDISGCSYFFDWGGGLIWLALPATAGANAEKIRAALKPCGGHATLVRAPDPERLKNPVFEIEGSLDLMRRVKQAFDPDAVFNPGRMVEGL
jgi:glycolate oxidase FAD binding subunit